MSLTVSLAVQNPIANPVTREKLNQLVSTAVGSVSGTVDAAQITNGAVTNPKLADAAVTEEKIADDAVTEGKIKDGSVTFAKLSTSDESGILFVRNAATATKTDTQALTTRMVWTDVTGLSLALTLRAATSKVLLLATVSISGSWSALRIVRNDGVLLQGDAAGTRTRVWATRGTQDTGNGMVTIPLMHLDEPGSTGPHTYKIQVLTTASSSVVARINYAATTYADSDADTSHRAVSTLTAVELFAI